MGFGLAHKHLTGQMRCSHLVLLFEFSVKDNTHNRGGVCMNVIPKKNIIIPQLNLYIYDVLKKNQKQNNSVERHSKNPISKTSW